MAFLDGLYGEITITSGDTVPIEDGFVFAIALDMVREMIDTTPNDRSTKRFAYGQGFAIIDFKAYVDGVTNPGVLNLQRATAVIRPHGGNANKKMTITGWIERYRWEIAIGTPTILVARLRSDDDAVFTWS